MKNHLNTTLPVGVGLGCALGEGLGTALHFVAPWLPLGIALGSSLGVGFGEVLNRGNTRLQ